MAKDYRKKKKSCVPLDGYQAEQLARLIHIHADASAGTVLGKS